MKIQPRGIVYKNDGTVLQWTRVIGEWVYHFVRLEASEHWQEPVTFTVRRHRYGRLFEGRETVHERLIIS